MALILCCADADLHRVRLLVGPYRVRAVRCTACGTLTLAAPSRLLNWLLRPLLACFWRGRFVVDLDGMPPRHPPW